MMLAPAESLLPAKSLLPAEAERCCFMWIIRIGGNETLLYVVKSVKNALCYISILTLILEKKKIFFMKILYLGLFFYDTW